jgi:hypothetical protein
VVRGSSSFRLKTRVAGMPTASRRLSFRAFLTLAVSLSRAKGRPMLLAGSQNPPDCAEFILARTHPPLRIASSVITILHSTPPLPTLLTHSLTHSFSLSLSLSLGVSRTREDFAILEIRCAIASFFFAQSLRLKNSLCFFTFLSINSFFIKIKSISMHFNFAICLFFFFFISYQFYSYMQLLINNLTLCPSRPLFEYYESSKTTIQ